MIIKIEGGSKEIAAFVKGLQKWQEANNQLSEENNQLSAEQIGAEIDKKIKTFEQKD